MDNIQSIINKYKYRLQAMQKHSFKNRKEIKIVKNRLQALGEANIDIMNTNITGFKTGSSEIDKNNYATYESKVVGAYKMYNAECDYGSELFGGVVDCRVSFIGGEGLSIIADNETLQNWCDDFIEKNNLNGSKLIDMILTGELEGKNFIQLRSDKEKKTVLLSSFSWYLNRYTVLKDKNNSDKIIGIKYKPKSEGLESSDEKTIGIEKAVFVKLGGTENINDETPSRSHKILTQCENASRATYDLRKNTHVFGKYMPYWKTSSPQSTAALKNDLAAKSFDIGDGYAGEADFSIVEPSGQAADAIIKDLLASLRYISAMTGVPIHWMAWPDLMSNRATAENMLEIINSATCRERLVWQEAFKEIIYKAREMAVNDLGAPNGILSGEVDVRLPLISLAMLKQIQETYLPLVEADYMSKVSLLNMLPKINPSKEKKLIEKEKEEAAEHSPMNNETIDQTLNDMQQKNIEQKKNIKAGGSGSGNFGHSGRKGIVGGSGGKGGGNNIDEHAEKIKSIIDNSNYDPRDTGARSLPEEQSNLSIGDNVPESYQWVDNESTGEGLGGTSAISIKNGSISEIKAAIKEAAKYSGEDIIIIGGKSSRGGEDPGEIVITEAKILYKFKKLDIL